nr:hypothetical protein CFP56_13972 [Quercus suber]
MKVPDFEISGSNTDPARPIETVVGYKIESTVEHTQEGLCMSSFVLSFLLLTHSSAVAPLLHIVILNKQLVFLDRMPLVLVSW